MDPILVITNLPDKTTALELAEKLISKKVAACVNLQAECTSIYRWQDKIENTSELPVFIKTLAEHYPRVEEIIKEMHPDELPEIISVSISGGLPAYLQWISDETATSNKK
ncbi:MAG: divalent-cation tolerance protein CutA [Nitrosomonadaceae bacterium]|jgi:periplasmic divalent cation tolerance protein|nr:divalent-cation tolerance protein CutA [Nitrosomonadaceae bacterium]|tara:strand:- start:128 stop:457 length:330 start_codon:yes stop_codon:yes gene_type:complete